MTDAYGLAYDTLHAYAITSGTKCTSASESRSHAGDAARTTMNKWYVCEESAPGSLQLYRPASESSTLWKTISWHVTVAFSGAARPSSVHRRYTTCLSSLSHDMTAREPATTAIFSAVLIIRQFPTDTKILQRTATNTSMFVVVRDQWSVFSNRPSRRSHFADVEVRLSTTLATVYVDNARSTGVTLQHRDTEKEQKSQSVAYSRRLCSRWNRRRFIAKRRNAKAVWLAPRKSWRKMCLHNREKRTRFYRRRSNIGFCSTESYRITPARRYCENWAR